MPIVPFSGPRMLKDSRSTERIIPTLTQESPTNLQNNLTQYLISYL